VQPLADRQYSGFSYRLKYVRVWAFSGVFGRLLAGRQARREAPFYSERQQAALLWCETLTFIAEGGAPDELFEEVRNEFSEDELVNLTLAIVTINA
jgi:alkylhydroperoxidase family enzyme